MALLFYLVGPPAVGKLTIARELELALRRGARFVPVWLSADTEALAARIANPQRSVRAKLMDPAVLKDLVTIPQLPAPGDAIVLDTTNLQPHEVVDVILASL